MAEGSIQIQRKLNRGGCSEARCREVVKWVKWSSGEESKSRRRCLYMQACSKRPSLMSSHATGGRGLATIAPFHHPPLRPLPPCPPAPSPSTDILPYKNPLSIMKAQFGRGKPHSPPRVWGCCSLSMHVLQGVSKFLVKWPAKSVQKFPKVRAQGKRLRIGCSKPNPHIFLQSQHMPLHHRHQQRKVYKKFTKRCIRQKCYVP